MKQDMIVILDLGSTENTVLARNIRDLGVYSEIHPHDITVEELKNLEDDRRKYHLPGKVRAPGTASNEMCTFLIINISSLQLIPVNVIAYRSQYGSVNPAAIAGPALLATIASTVAGVVFCKVMDRKKVDF